MVPTLGDLVDITFGDLVIDGTFGDLVVDITFCYFRMDGTFGDGCWMAQSCDG